MGIISAAELQQRLRIPDSADDGELQLAAAAANEATAQYCGRSFEKVAVVDALPRLFGVTGGELVVVDDFWTTTGLVVKSDDSGLGTYGTTWALTTDYTLEPANGRQGGVAFPYSAIRSTGVRWWPLVWQRRLPVQVTAAWGWASVPATVKTATLIQASRWFRRKDSPEGVIGGADFAAVRVSRFLDPDVELALGPYRTAEMAIQAT